MPAPTAASRAIEAIPPTRQPRPASRRLLTFGVALLTSLVGIGAWPAMAAAADPEGGTTAMRQQLDEATRGYVEAKAKLDASKTRQAQLTQDLAVAEQQLTVQTAAVGRMARSAYEVAGFSVVAGVISTGSAHEFLDSVALLNAVSTHQTNLVRTLLNTQAEANAVRASIDAEIGAQQEQLIAMEQRKQQAERALWSVGGGQEVSGFSAASEVIAEASPRNADGSWPRESMSIYEPTTGGYITPRLAHAKAQAQAAGFNHFVSCYRPLEDGGEHPRGRACDFAAMTTGFGGAAYGDDKTYGTNLAAFFLFNADRLGVLYIIWYRQIWLPGSGWRVYNGCCDPSSQHTNHVHLSVY